MSTGMFKMVNGERVELTETEAMEFEVEWQHEQAEQAAEGEAP